MFGHLGLECRCLHALKCLRQRDCRSSKKLRSLDPPHEVHEDTQEGNQRHARVQFDVEAAVGLGSDVQMVKVYG